MVRQVTYEPDPKHPGVLIETTIYVDDGGDGCAVTILLVGLVVFLGVLAACIAYGGW